MRRARRRFLSDRQAQMMLLTAFVLVIGFVALAGMVARLNQLPEATRQAGDRPIYTEAAAVSRGVLSSMERINELMAPENGTDLENKDVQSAVTQALDHMTRLESAQGFRLQIDSVSCAVGPNPDEEVTLSVQYSLADTRTRIQFSTDWTILDPNGSPVDAEGNPIAWCTA